MIATKSAAFEIASEMALTDIRCAPDRGALVRRVLDAREWDAAVECEWSLATVIDEFRVPPAVARQAIELYPNALRAEAELRAADADEADAEEGTAG